MLRFVRFRVKNAGPFKDLDVPLENLGTVRIKGANGVGKSSLWHLLTQCLYGQTPNGAKKSELLSDEARDYLLEVTFEKDGHTFVAAHAVKSKIKTPDENTYGSGVYLFQDGVNISLHKDPDTQKLIRQTIGWSLSEWYGYVYLAQRTVHTLILGTRSERQEYLSQLFNLQKLDELHVHYKAEAERLSGVLDSLKSLDGERSVKLQLLNGRNSIELQTKLAEVGTEYTELLLSIKTLRDQVQAYAKLNEVEAELTEALKTKPTETTAELDALENKYSTTIFEAEVLERKLQDLESELFVLNRSLVSVSAEDEALLKKELPDERTLIEKNVELKSIENRLLTCRVLNAPVLPQFVSSVEEAQAYFLALSTQKETELLTDFTSIALVGDKLKKLENRKPAPAKARPDTNKRLQQVIELKSEGKGIATKLAKLTASTSTECPTCGSELDLAHREKEAKNLLAQKQDIEEQLSVLESVLKKEQLLEVEWVDYEKQGPDETHLIPRLKQQVELSTKYQLLQDWNTKQDLFDAWNKERIELELKLKELPEVTRLLREWDLKKNLQKTMEKQIQTKARLEVLAKEKTVLNFNLGQVLGGLTLLEIRTQRKETALKVARSKKVESLQGQRVELLKAVTGLNDIELKKALEDAVKRSEELMASRGSVGAELREVSLLEASVRSLGEQLIDFDKIERQAGLNKLVAKSYGKAGVLRERQISKFSNYLEQVLIAYTLKQLPLHRFRIVADDGIDIMCSKEGGREYDVRLMSGGEMGALSVAFLFALDDLLPPAKRTNLKILDEIESAFDKERQADFLISTLPKLKERVETLCVISHSSAAEGSFDRTWEIVGGGVKESQEVREFERM